MLYSLGLSLLKSPFTSTYGLSISKLGWAPESNKSVSSSFNLVNRSSFPLVGRYLASAIIYGATTTAATNPTRNNTDSLLAIVFVQQQPKKKTETFGYCVSCVYFLAYCFDSRRLYIIIVFCVGNNHERRLTVRSEEFESRASGADFYSDGRRAPRGCEWVYCKVCDE